MEDTHTNLVSLLRERASRQPDRETYRFIEASGAKEIGLSNRELDLRARAFAVALGDHPGQRVLLLFPPGLDYIAAFFGCLYAGAVAVPAYPPHVNRPKRSFVRLQTLADDARISLILTTRAIASLRAQSGLAETLPWLAVEDIPLQISETWSEPSIDEATLALLQYTSGSTANPKGVMLSHGNLCHNQRLIAAGFATTQKDIIVSWLPLYHDMGLIGGVLHPLFLGARCYLMAPMDFLRKPLFWLETISRVGATVSGAPDFAYALACAKVGEQERANLDLSRWQVAFSGAEPVRAATLSRFADTFAARGFRPENFYPCYGLAEATLFVAGGRRSSAPLCLVVDPSALAENRITPGVTGTTLVSAGSPRQKVRIVDPQTGVACPPASVGEIWIAGPSVAGGYFGQVNPGGFGARLSGESESFLRSGDLGFLYDHQLFITGRIKDLIIIRGRNHYPQDIELTAQNCHPALAPGCSAAFSAEIGGSERLVVVQEVRRTALRGLPKQQVVESIRIAIAQNHELQVHAVVLLKPGRLAKTSSGKVQRTATRTAFLADELAAVESCVLESAAVDVEPEALTRVELDALPATARRARLSAYLLDMTAATLGVASAILSLERPLTGLGLDSLAAVRLSTRTREDLAIDLPMAQILEGANLNRLSDLCLELLAATPATPPAGVSVEAMGDFPLSYNQWALWFLYRLAPHSAAYHVSFALDIGSPHAPMDLMAHFYQLVENHPMLRTRFLISGSGVVQHVVTTPLHFFGIADGQDWDEQDLNAYLTEETLRPFDLEKGPPLRVRLINRGPADSVLLVCAHHIAVDFQSMVTILGELGQLVAAGDRGYLAPPQASYFDFVNYQSNLLQGPRRAELEVFWQKTLTGQSAALDLPTDRPRPTELTFRGDTLDFEIKAHTTQQLRRLARQEETTLFSTLLATYALLLARYSNRGKLIVGTPATMRDRGDFEDVVGYLINTLPICFDLIPETRGQSPCFLDLLGRVRKTMAGAMAHKDYPFQLMVEQTPLDRDRGRAPIFQTLFVFLQPDKPDQAPFAALRSGSQLNLGGLRLLSRKVPRSTAQFDLTLAVVEGDKELFLTFEYNTDLFDRSTLRQLAGHFNTLLAAILADPTTQLSQLPLESEAARLAFLHELNDTTPAVVVDRLIFTDFEAWAASTPAATALIHGLERVSYYALNQRANQLAWFLRDMGLLAGERVGICHARNPDMLAAMLAVLKAGGAYVPMDPAYPADRLAYILDRSEARFILTDAQTTVPDHDGQTLRLTELDLDKSNSANPPRNARPDNLAYVIYTSGSTGKPKGVSITHNNASAMLTWAKTVFSREELAGTLAATSICFDLSIFELFLPLSVGTTIYLAENALHLANLPARDQVTLINTVPSAVAELIHADAIPDSVQTVNMAGELLSRELVAAVYAAASVKKVYDLYGPSEDTTYSTYALRRAERPVTIGRPIAWTRAYLLDRHLSPVVRGVPGELFLAGEGITRGYQNDPARTAERYLPDPFAVSFPVSPGARMYRTGDLVRYRFDPHAREGNLHFLGRIDHQVKIRGFRIEPDEVAAVVSGHPQVETVVVICRRDPKLRLVAYLVARPNSKTSIVDFLHERLPAYMMPSAFVFLDTMPMTPNGKLDRRALPAPDPDRDMSSITLPRTATERVLAAVWRELFHLQQIDRGDHFFDLGGHSLLATRFVTRMEAHFGIRLPVGEVFAFPILARLAEKIDSHRRQAAADRPGLYRLNETGPSVPSFAQWRLWFLDRFETNVSAYIMPMAVRLRGELNSAALERCFHEIVARHAVLRSRFHEVDERLIVETTDFEAPTMTVVDLSYAGEDQLRALARTEAGKAFDLIRGPLFRLHLLRLAPREHVLLWTVHHIVSDGWSIGVLTHELNSLYAAFVQEHPSSLPDLPVSYADFARWQREWLRGEVLAEQIAYWRRHLAGSPPLLELPTDRPRPSRQTFVGRTLSFEVIKEVTQNLKKLGNDSGTSLFMATIGAFATLLYRYTGAQDLVIGTPVANRSHPDVEPLIGFFANMLPLRFDLSGNPSFSELLARVRRTALDAFAHEDVPFEQLLEELKPERAMSYSPVFQVGFAFQNTPLMRGSLPGLNLEALDSQSTASKFDMTLYMEEQGNHLLGTLEYNTDLFDEARIRRLAGHFAHLLGELVALPGRRLADFEMVNETERHCLLHTWNDTHREEGRANIIHRRFELQAANRPDALALICEHGSLTYGELEARANRLAHYLREHGVGPEQRVGLTTPRSRRAMIAILAILKTGAAYLPIDASLPEARVAYLLENASPRLLLTDRELADVLPETVPKLFLDQLVLDNRLPSSPPRITVYGENLAYLMYTSGSTGLPKAVEAPHQAVLRLFARDGFLPFGPKMVWMQYAPLSFDAATLEIWGAFLHGSVLACPPAGQATLEELAHFICRQRVNPLWMTTALFHLFAEEYPQVFDDLDYLVTGGEVISPAAIEAVFLKRPDITILNAYGPTENTTFTTVFPMVSWDVMRPVPIGYPIAETTVYLLDKHHRLAPRGVVGQLFTGGQGLARGYLGQAALTALAFVPNPFSKQPGQRLYRTGDQAQWLEAADDQVPALTFLGRSDFQVKIRGFRVEPGEIAAVIRDFEGVRASVVVCRTEPEQRLIAYLAADSSLKAPLSDFLREQLPVYMFPSALVFLESLPMTPNGKLDLAALPEPDSPGPALVTAPETETERIVAAIWCELFHLDEIDRGAHFFELGGHSLLATRFISRVQAHFGVSLPVASVFTFATLDGQAREIDTLLRTELDERPPLVPLEGKGPHVLSFAQQRLWFLDRFDTDRSAYNIPIAARLFGVLDVCALEHGFNQIVARQNSLRTCFPEEGEQPYQVVAPFLPFQLDFIDLTGAPETWHQVIARTAAVAPFDLLSGPLFRLKLLRLTPREHLLLWNTHHIISDGWSLGVLINELGALYTAYLAGQPCPLVPLPVQYTDFAAWQRAWLGEKVLEKKLAYWRQQLSEAPSLLELPGDRPRPAIQSYRGAQLGFRVGQVLSRDLKSLSTQSDASLFMTLAAAFAALLSRYSGCDDLVIGSPVASRNHPDIEPLIGFFVNMLPLRFDLKGNPGFRELLARVRQTALDGFAHEDVPFEQLVEAQQPERGLSYSPLFQVAFVFQNTPLAQAALPGLVLEAFGSESTTAKFDMTLYMEEQGNHLLGTLEYNTDLFDEARIRRLAGHFAHLLGELVAFPGRRLADFEMVNETERHCLLHTWNDTHREEGRANSIHRRFELQAANRPDALALICEHGSLTYGELETRANRLAHYLREHGVGPEQRVGLTAPRSRRAMVAILAILKTGAAYLPIDPSLPEARIAFLLKNAAPRLLLTDQEFADVLPETVPLLFFDQIELDNRLPSSPPPIKVYAENLAYLMYTSGSTGLPKAVGTPHQAVLRLFARDGFLPFGPNLVWLQYAPLSFDAATLEIWAALLHGSPLVCPLAGQMSLEELVRFIQDQRVNSMWLTAALFHLFAQEHPNAFDGVDYLLAGGDVLSPTSLEVVLNRRPDLTVINGYGPTENTTFTTVFSLTSPRAFLSVPIGYPIAETTVYLLDKYHGLAARGVVGQLYTGGQGLARGYLGQPALTALAFVPNPFSKQPGQRLYRTGDQAQWLNAADDQLPALAFLGRSDFQVKIRGFRVEPGEIAAVIRGFEHVADAAVVCRSDPEKRLIAYVAAEPELKTPLVKFLGDRLPAYMIPSAFVFLESLPMTPNGKLDLKALPVPISAEPTLITAPQTATERVVAGIWRELFHLDKIDRGAHFFDLGGHSLLATRFISRIQAHYGVSLPVASVFTTATLDGLAGEIDELLRKGKDGRPALLRLDGEEPQILSFAQQRLWFLNRFEVDRSAYNIPSALRLRGPLDMNALEESFNQIIARHNSLRTCFREVDGQPRQVVIPFSAVAMVVVDLARAPEGWEQALAHAEALEPFNLSRAPLFRLKLLQLGPWEHVLLWTTHHIISDGWSLGVLINELNNLYMGFRDGLASPLAPLSVQYTDFAVWQRAWLSEEVLKEKLAYWKQQLAGAPSLLDLPTDRPRPAVQTYRGSQLSFRVGEAVSQELKNLGKRTNASLFMTGVSAFATLLSRYSGSTDLVIGVPVANRNHPDIEPLIGFFANMLPLRFDLSGNPSFNQLLKRVQRAALNGFVHEDVPFEQLVEELQPERNLSYSPVFQVAFAQQNPALAEAGLADLELEILNANTTTAKFELTLVFAEQHNHLVGNLEYNTDLFDKETILRLAGHLELLLGQVVAEPERRLSDFNIVSQPELARLLAWSRHRETYPGGQTIDALFAAAAARTPEKVALVQGDQVLTYDLLAKRVSLLAGRLQHMGAASPNRLLGLLTEQGPDLVIGILGILRAGAAFVPLDPNLPDERLRFMLDDCNMETVVCQPAFRQRLAEISLIGRIVLINDETGSSMNPAAPGRPEDLAYVIYTSGSTGKPKGVPITHDALVPLLTWGRDSFALSEKTRALQSLNHAFDYGIFEVLTPLLFGGSLITPKLLDRGLPDRFAETIRDLCINTLHATPSFFHAVVASPRNLTSLTCLVMGAEVVTHELVDAIFASVSERCVVHNAYGPTEASIISTTFEIGRPGQGPIALPVPIGAACGDKTLYVMDPTGRLMPPGIPGELYIGGPGLSRGYLGRPALAAEKFVPDGMAKTPGQRLYRSGDLVRYRPNGQLLFVGRIDHQVKIRGFRVELDEVRNTLENSPAVAQAIVLTTEQGSAGKKLIAYVISSDQSAEVGRSGGEEELARWTSDLKTYLSQHLPAYMIPSAYVFLKEFPLTPNGKLDRAALPKPEARVTETRFMAPGTGLERGMAAIWARLLGLERVGTSDNFFELGGHSLMVVQLQEALKLELGHDLSMVTLFEFPTIRALARHLEDAGGAKKEQAGRERGGRRRAAGNRDRDRRRTRNRTK